MVTESVASVSIDESGYGGAVRLTFPILCRLFRAVTRDMPRVWEQSIHVLRVRHIPEGHPDRKSGSATTYYYVAELVYNEEGHRAIYGFNGRVWSCFMS